MNNERKIDVANAIISRCLCLTEISCAEKFAPGAMVRVRLIGDISAAHSVFAKDNTREIVDVWNGRKVFSARLERGAESWKIVNFKRGEWESGFLCAT